jgi:hypothetical protein
MYRKDTRCDIAWHALAKNNGGGQLGDEGEENTVLRTSL